MSTHITMAIALTKDRPDKPTETILSSPQDGHAPGDLSIRLSEDLAKRLTEMIERNRQCAAGNGRPSAKDAHVKDFHVADVLDNIGEIECASKSIILNGFPGGPFGELYGIDIDPVIWASQAMMDMLAGLTSFALSVGKGFASNPGSTTTLALYAAYLSYMQIQSRKPLGAENWIAQGYHVELANSHHGLSDTNYANHGNDHSKLFQPTRMFSVLYDGWQHERL
jgi:hypothetical protein